jgi:hypothetical protein
MPAAPPLTPEERAAKIAWLLEEADRPGASPDVRARAARVREILERAEARAREQERDTDVTLELAGLLALAVPAPGGAP